MPQDKVRVLRIVEYVGDRARVEEAVSKAIHGELDVGAKYNKGNLVIRAATIGTYPEILETEKPKDFTGDLNDE